MHRSKAGPTFMLTTLLGWCGVVSCTDSSPEPAVGGIVRIATEPSQLLSGPEVAGRIGDYVFDNGEVRFVVQSPDSSTGWGLYGGALMDAATLRADGPSVDGLEEIFVQCDLRGFRPTSAEIVEPGGDDSPGILRLIGADGGIPFLDALLPRDPLEVSITVDLLLPAKGRTLDIKIAAKDERKKGARDLACGIVLLPGDSHQMYVPGVGLSDEFGGKQAYLAAEAGAGGTSYVLHKDDEPLNVLISGFPFLPIATDPKPFLANATLRETYHLTMGAGPGVHSALVAAGFAGGPDSRVVTLTLTGAEVAELQEVSVIFVNAALGSRSVVTAEVLDAQSQLQVDLPPATYEVILRSRDRGAELQRFPLEVVAGEGALVVEQAVGGLGAVLVTSTALGLDGSATGPTPVRIRVIGGHGAQPAAGASYEAYAQPEHRFSLAAGSYTVVVSRGPEHELHVEDIVVAEGETVAVQAELRQVVDRSGWVSADLHVHGTRSSDSEVARLVRVLGAAAEGLDVLLATDHDAVTDYRPEVAELGLQDRLRTASGIEMSMLYGHINGFPVEATNPADHWRPAWFVYDADGRYERAKEPVEVIQALRNVGAQVVQINHPRASQSLFNYLDLDPMTGATEKTWPEPDALELLNGKRLDEYNQVIQDFHGILLSGRRVTGTGTSDIHGEFGVGYARTYVRVDDSGSLADFDLQKLWDGLKSGRAIAASGSFVEVTVQQGQSIGAVGDTIEVTGPVTLNVRVQAPSWMKPSHIKIYQRRGVLVERDITMSDADPRNAAMRFEGTFTATVTQDTYFMVEVSGTEGRPWIDDELTVTNPIFVDADGGGLSF